jgi:hypothetical protein
MDRAVLAAGIADESCAAFGDGQGPACFVLRDRLGNVSAIAAVLVLAGLLHGENDGGSGDGRCMQWDVDAFVDVEVASVEPVACKLGGL